MSTTWKIESLALEIERIAQSLMKDQYTSDRGNKLFRLAKELREQFEDA